MTSTCTKTWVAESFLGGRMILRLNNLQSRNDDAKTEIIWQSGNDDAKTEIIWGTAKPRFGWETHVWIHYVLEQKLRT